MEIAFEKKIKQIIKDNNVEKEFEKVVPNFEKISIRKKSDQILGLKISTTTNRIININFSLKYDEDGKEIIFAGMQANPRKNEDDEWVEEFFKIIDQDILQKYALENDVKCKVIDMPDKEPYLEEVGYTRNNDLNLILQGEIYNFYSGYFFDIEGSLNDKNKKINELLDYVKQYSSDEYNVLVIEEHNPIKEIENDTQKDFFECFVDGVNFNFTVEIKKKDNELTYFLKSEKQNKEYKNDEELKKDFGSFIETNYKSGRIKAMLNPTFDLLNKNILTIFPYFYRDGIKDELLKYYSSIEIEQKSTNAKEVDRNVFNFDLNGFKDKMESRIELARIFDVIFLFNDEDETICSSKDKEEIVLKAKKLLKEKYELMNKKIENMI